MSRPRKTVRTVYINLGIPEDLEAQLRQSLHSEVEGKVPHGALQSFFVDRLREFFSPSQPQSTAAFSPASPGRIYIAGPMSGYPNFNHPAFHAMERNLQDQGCLTINPATIHPHTDQPYEFYLRSSLQALLTCNSIMMLAGWERSAGACLEKRIADSLAMPVFYESSDFVGV